MKSNILNNNQNYINRWIVSYADFTTMLLALFMVLYALSQIDINNIKIFSNSINKAFDKSDTRFHSPNLDFNEKSKLEKLFKTTQATVYSENSTLSASDKLTETLQKQLSASLDNVSSGSKKLEKIYNMLTNEEGQKINWKIIREPRGVLIKLNETELFDKGSDIIIKGGMPILDKIVMAVINEPNSIRIETHTINTGANINQKHSRRELSLLRAVSLINYFVETKNLKQDRFSATGFTDLKKSTDDKNNINDDSHSEINIVILNPSSKVFEQSIPNITGNFTGNTENN